MRISKPVSPDLGSGSSRGLPPPVRTPPKSSAIDFARASVFACILTYHAASAGAQPPPEKIYFASEVRGDGTIVVEVYTRGASKQIPSPAVEPWAEIVGDYSPLKSTYWGWEPDWQSELLSKGLAKLKRLEGAPPSYVEAQKTAQANGKGLWATSKPPLWTSSKPPTTSPPTSDPPKRSIDWKRIKKFVAFWGGLGTLIASVLALIAWLVRRLRRRRLHLVILGPPATGKTWLWTRLVNPEVTRGELLKIKQTTSRDALKSPVPETWGHYLVTPVYVDVPGGQPGTHLTELLSRKLFSRSKHIWVVVLATTADSSIKRISPEARKLDQDFISEQRGYINLPLAVLSARGVPKPSMVIVVITKYDLFSEKTWTPDTSDSSVAVLDTAFSLHVGRLREECKRRGVPFALEYSSALEGWRTDALLRHIKKALFAG